MPVPLILRVGVGTFSCQAKDGVDIASKVFRARQSGGLVVPRADEALNPTQ